MRNRIWLTTVSFDPMHNEARIPDWIEAYADLARDEGWGIDEHFKIVRNDKANRFPDDASALAHVRERAAQGSEAHFAALAMHERVAPAAPRGQEEAPGKLT